MLKTIYSIFIFVMVLSLMAGCANQGSPVGGPMDEDPPVLIKSTPLLNETNYKKNKVTLFFDEIVVLKDISKNFIISPPLEEDPKITTLGKKVSIDINNELLDSTTYTIYLGSSIVDNNQGNPLPDLTFSFSTGPVLDSMELAGTLLNAEDLEPLASTIVGIYKDLDDSAVIRQIPLRIAQTNEQGEFVIKNVAPGKYHIFGLPEMVKNYRYDDPSDRIAFLDAVIIPNFDTIQLADTTWLDSITVDTIIWRDALEYGPRDLTLLSFSEFMVAKNIKKRERSEPWLLLYSFSKASDTLPRIRLENQISENWYLTEQSLTGDTIMYWITDSMIHKIDTLGVIVEYMKTDSMQIDRWQTDTIQMVYRQPRKATDTKKSRKKDNTTVKKLPVLGYTSNLRGNLHINESIQFDFDTPVKPFDNSSFRLFETQDTLKKQLNFSIKQDERLIRRYRLISNLTPGNSYTLEMDSGAITSIYGFSTDKKTASFTINKEDQYGNIDFILKGQTSDGIVSLLNEKGKKLRQQAFKVDQEIVSFRLVVPGTYFAMLFYDLDGNEAWTTGNYLEKKQAEGVRYFPKKLVIKAYRDYEEDWLPENGKLTEQKPRELIGLKKD